MGSTDQVAAATGASVTASARLFEDACAVIPGGVNSPVRAFTAVGGTPRFITEAHGCWLTDADGNRYVDLVCSWGPMILGHAHPAVVEAVAKAAANGLSFGAPTPAESQLATEIIGRVAPVERIRHGELRHRGHHERGAAGPRVHRPRQDRQVLRLLPRPRRRAARRRGFRGGDAGPAVLARGHRRDRGRHNRVALQRHRRRAADIRPVRRRDRRGDHRSQPRQHGRRPARGPATTRRCARSPPSTARC